MFVILCQTPTSSETALMGNRPAVRLQLLTLVTKKKLHFSSVLWLSSNCFKNTPAWSLCAFVKFNWCKYMNGGGPSVGQSYVVSLTCSKSKVLLDVNKMDERGIMIQSKSSEIFSWVAFYINLTWAKLETCTYCL